MDNEEKEKHIWIFLQEKLDIHSKNALYITAFKHSIDINTDQNGKANDELAYLGDFIVNAAIGIHLYTQHPDWKNGELSEKSNTLRSDSNLANRVRKQLPDFSNLIIVADEKTDKNDTVVAKAVEALFGAIYLDQGFDKARALAEKHLLRPGK
jgi:ribonuclease-3